MFRLVFVTWATVYEQKQIVKGSDWIMDSIRSIDQKNQMPLNVTPRMENEIGILELEGSLTLGPNLHRVREAVRQLLADAHPRGLALEVSKLVSADSAGLGELTVVYTLASRQGCRVVLSGVGQSLATMLEVTHLDELLPTVANLTSAAAFLTLR